MKQVSILLSIIVLFITAGCQNDSVSATIPPMPTEEVVDTPPPAPTVVPELEPQAPSCSNPTPEIAGECAAQEAQILGATVRIVIEMSSPHGDGSQLLNEEATSHATLVNNRYLVTHNHFPVALQTLTGATDDTEVRLTITKLDGTVILGSVSQRKFDVVSEQAQTLVIDFRETGEVLFKANAIQSMPLAVDGQQRPEPGTEVAQINWDGETTRVDWVQVKEVVERDGVTQIVIDNGVQTGASGGGIFWNGAHIGNNWHTADVLSGSSDVVVSSFSVAAYNSNVVVSS